MANLFMSLSFVKTSSVSPTRVDAFFNVMLIFLFIYIRKTFTHTSLSCTEKFLFRNAVYIAGCIISNCTKNESFPLRISKDFCRFLRIWSHLLKKSLMENFIFCEVLKICALRHYGYYMFCVVNSIIT